MPTEFDDFAQQYEATLRHAIATADDRWSITGYKGHNTRNGFAYVATLRLDRKIVGHLEDAGQGGGVRIDFLGPDGRNVGAENAWTAEIARVLPDEPLWAGGEMLAEALLQKGGK